MLSITTSKCKYLAINHVKQEIRNLRSLCARTQRNKVQVRGVLGNKCAGQNNGTNQGNYVEITYMENPFLHLKASESWPIE